MQTLKTLAEDGRSLAETTAFAVRARVRLVRTAPPPPMTASSSPSSAPIPQQRAPRPDTQPNKLIADELAAVNRAKIVRATERREVGRWLVKEITRMGPVFIKLGQFVACRGDLIDEDLASELEKLQDDIAPEPIDPNGDVMRELKTLGVTIEETPFACASISQCYRGMTRDRQRVVVKLKRPSIDVAFQRDVWNIEKVLLMFQMCNVPGTTDCLDVFRESRALLCAELDFLQEQLNARRFAHSLKDVPWVRVPRIMVATRDYIVMEEMPGIKVSDVQALKAAGVDVNELAYKLMTCFCVQVLRNGLFHGDPQSGNIAVCPYTSDLIFYDYGAIVQSAQLKAYMPRLINAFITKDCEEIISIVLDMRVITQVGSRAELRQSISLILKYFDTMDTMTFHSTIASKDVLRGGTAFKLTAAYIYLFRSVNMLEGVCKQLNPEFTYMKFFEFIKPHIPQPSINTEALLKTVLAVPTTVKNVSEIIMEMDDTHERTKVSLERYVNMTLGLQGAMTIVIALASLATLAV
jgi:predicted unusual protein kinase regulating ubiquinone biosynthesis (AarF/ABC1/UbiB family)